MRLRRHPGKQLLFVPLHVAGGDRVKASGIQYQIKSIARFPIKKVGQYPSDFHILRLGRQHGPYLLSPVFCRAT